MMLFQCPNASHAPFYAERLPNTSSIYCEECKCNRCADSSCGRRTHPKCNCATVSQLEVQRGFDAYQKVINVVKPGRDKESVNAELLAEIKVLNDAKDVYALSEKLFEKARHCPHCQRVIVDGCDSLVCGRDTHGTTWYGGCRQPFNWATAKPYATQGDGGYGDRIALLTKKLNKAAERKTTNRRCAYCNKNTEVGLEATCVNCDSFEYYCFDCVVTKQKCIHDDKGTHLFAMVNEGGNVVGTAAVTYLVANASNEVEGIETQCPGAI